VQSVQYMAFKPGDDVLNSLAGVLVDLDKASDFGSSHL
jgi:hypothetical protein